MIGYLSLGLTQDLGSQVEPLWPRKIDAMARRDLHVRSLVDQGKLLAPIRVPAAAGTIDLEADLRGRRFRPRLSCQHQRRDDPATRISWILRQLAGARDDILVEVRYPNQKEPTSSTLKDARAKPERLLYASDLRREPDVVPHHDVEGPRDEAWSAVRLLHLGVEAADVGVLPIRRAGTPGVVARRARSCPRQSSQRRDGLRRAASHSAVATESSERPSIRRASRRRLGADCREGRRHLEKVSVAHLAGSRSLRVRHPDLPRRGAWR